jgi:predicted nucleic acid-binding protein
MNFMSAGKTFIDANVLVYAHDIRSVAKRNIANSTLRRLWEEGSGAVSAQVLQEFYMAVTRKIPKPLPKDIARAVVRTYERWCGETTFAEVASAFEFEDQYGINFWDALIVATARKSGAIRILSEDFNDGQLYAGMIAENPFAGIQP